MSRPPEQCHGPQSNVTAPRAMSLHTPRLALHTGTPWHTGAVIPGTRRVGRGWGGLGAGSGAGRPARVGAGVGHWNFGRDRKTV